MSVAWIDIAWKLRGTAEIPGPKHNSTIQKWLVQLKAWWSDDETPWCGAFVAHCVKEAGIQPPKNWFRAKEWATWGQPVQRPCVGTVLVFERQGGGHVGFYWAEDETAYHVLGGNQGNKVSITRIAKYRCIAKRWPTGVPITTAPFVVEAKGGLSKNEA